MAKKKTSLFECQHCGFTTPKWMGKCPNCGGWDSFLELSEEQQDHIKLVGSSNEISKAMEITQITEEITERFSSDDTELDMVLGGGIVPGSLTLIGGSPGVGKSTLLLKIGSNLAQQGRNVLYVSGEESTGQIKLRANRLNANVDNLYLLSEIRLEKVLLELSERPYSCIIIDSIQTLYSETIPSAPGSVTQVRQITFDLMRIAKEKKQQYIKHKNMQNLYISGEINYDQSDHLIDMKNNQISNDIIEMFENKLTKEKKNSKLGIEKFYSEETSDGK